MCNFTAATTTTHITLFQFIMDQTTKWKCNTNEIVNETANWFAKI